MHAPVSASSRSRLHHKSITASVIPDAVSFSYKRTLSTSNKLCGRPPQYAPPPVTLTFNLLTFKVVSESRVTWTTYVPILVFLGLSVLDLGLMYATDRQTDVRQHHPLMPRLVGGGIINTRAERRCNPRCNCFCRRSPRIFS